MKILLFVGILFVGNAVMILAPGLMRAKHSAEDARWSYSARLKIYQALDRYSELHGKYPLSLGELGLESSITQSFRYWTNPSGYSVVFDGRKR